jgi:hypothetical protein
MVKVVKYEYKSMKNKLNALVEGNGSPAKA